MVDRYSCVITREKFAQLLNLPKFKNKIERQYNISPLDKAYVLLKEGENVNITQLTWGLLPASNKTHENKGNLYNALIEKLPSSPSFRIPYRMKRCLVPADSFYFYDKVNSKTIPYRISLRNGKAMFFAGLYDEWTSPMQSFKTFTLITGPTDDYTVNLGSRIPFIFNSLEEGLNWVNDTDLKGSLTLLKKPKQEDLKIYRITDDALNPKFNQPEMHEEYHKELTLFD